jgi:hypothetical protein
MVLKTKKQLKNEINPNSKLFSMSDMSPQAKKRKKHLGETALMKWNPLTPM